jgi:chaperonin cofactor prefoldin
MVPANVVRDLYVLLCDVEAAASDAGAAWSGDRPGWGGHVEHRLEELERQVEALMTQREPVSTWGHDIEGRLEKLEGKVGGPPGPWSTSLAERVAAVNRTVREITEAERPEVVHVDELPARVRRTGKLYAGDPDATLTELISNLHERLAMIENRLDRLERQLDAPVETDGATNP